MTHKVWLEGAMNGPWSRRYQPNIPEDEIVSEAIACAEAGAAIVHMHAYDPVTGRQRGRHARGAESGLVPGVTQARRPIVRSVRAHP